MWAFFKITCVLHMLLSAFLLLRDTISMFNNPVFGTIAGFFLYLLAFLFSIFGISLVSSNYPDVPVIDDQKKRFNRLYILNFIFLIVLFGKIIASFQYVSIMKGLFNVSMFSLPYWVYMNMLLHVALLVFQFILFFGLYKLRIELYRNFRKKEFEFESDRLSS
jgi:hypothetical protein